MGEIVFNTHIEEFLFMIIHFILIFTNISSISTLVNGPKHVSIIEIIKCIIDEHDHKA